MLWIVCAVLVIVLGGLVLAPLFRTPVRALDMEMLEETEADRLLRRKAVCYANLRDLEFEHKMDRLSDADYASLRAGYKAEAAGILRKLEELGVSDALDASIEKEIAARRSRMGGANRSAARQEARCASCGAAAIPGKKFCPDCGQRIHKTERP